MSISSGSFKELIEYICYCKALIDSVDIDIFYRNVWLLNESYAELEYFEKMPLSKYFRLVETFQKIMNERERNRK